MRLETVISPRKIGLILAVLSLYFAAQSLVTEYLIENVLDGNYDSHFVHVLDLFSVNTEKSLPTWYATLMLFFAAVLLAAIAAVKIAAEDRYARYWAGLAVIFLYLSMDEGAVIHEIVADITQESLALTGYLTFGWQIVAAPLVILFALLYLRFLLHLPRPTRNLFVLAGMVYVGGALIVEGVSANQLFLDGEITFEYLAIATVEELSEMLGVVVFIYALLSYAAAMSYSFAFNLHPTMQAIADPVANEAAQESRRVSPPFWQRRSIILPAVLIAGLNLVLVSWALTREIGAPVVSNSGATTQAVIDQLVTDDVLVTRLVGRFGVDNLTARQVVAPLLTLYDHVMVIHSISTGSSIVLAGDNLPFDPDTLTGVLRANGITQFVIFDMPAVQAIVGDLQISVP